MPNIARGTMMPIQWQGESILSLQRTPLNFDVRCLPAVIAYDRPKARFAVDFRFVDTLVGARVLLGTTIPHRNRLAVILMDTAFETACRAFLKQKKRIKLTDAHRSRETLVKATRGNLKDIDDGVWEGVAYYHEEIRNDLYHESAGKTITDTALLDYQDTIEFVIGRALDVSIGAMVSAEVEELKKAAAVEPVQLGTVATPSLRGVSNRVDKLVFGVAAVQPHNVDALNEYFRREGDSLRLKAAELANIVARNSGGIV